MGSRGLRDERFMRMALNAAVKGLGRTSPNPPVGAVVVRGNTVLSRAYHKAAGQAHAEAAALAKLDFKAKGADLFVTLEPCDHYGHTPPCTEAILRSGVRRVVVGCKDPSDRVAGRGIRKLRKAGVEVTLGVLEEKCRRLTEAFAVWATAGRAHVTLKAAVTLDGRVATRTGHSRWVTGEQARLEGHRLRDRCDAVLVGGGTVRADDPQLTCRLPGGRGRDPMRVVLSGRLDLPLKAKVFHASSGSERARVVVATTGRPDPKKVRGIEKLGVEVWRLPGRAGVVDLEGLLSRLAREDVVSLLVEGGGGVHGRFMDAGLCDRAVFMVAPKILGGRDAVPAVGGKGPATMAGAATLDRMEVRRLGEDILISGVPDFSGRAKSAERSKKRSGRGSKKRSRPEG